VSARSAGPLARLPVFWEYQAPERWRSIDFISDLHLQASHPRTFEAFASHLRHTDADAVFILGDLFEAWVGDDARHSGFEAQAFEVLKEVASLRALAFMPGNRDFLVGSAMLEECGAIGLSDPTVLVAFGARVLLTHGDALCIEDVTYQAFRTQVRDARWQAAFLARPLAERRAIAAQMRTQSQKHQAQQRPENWADVDTASAVQWMQQAGTPVLVHGHTHRPARESLAPGFVREVLPDWDFDAPEPRGAVLRLSAAGLRRIEPSREGARAR
jgi:UDP-2,3-diacylglucosamine hydrolase